MPEILQSRLKIAPEALFQDVEGEIVILHQDKYFSLDNVGARVWAWIAEHSSVDGLLAALLNDYEIDEATLRRDVTSLLDRMVAEGLVVIEA